jgi:hypothetical protein
MDAITHPSGSLRQRDHFIPARKSDILRALLDDALGGEPEREQFRQICRLLASIYHYEYFDQLERMRDDYFYFNPEHDSRPRFDAATIEKAYRDLVDRLAAVLHGANFIEVTHEEIERAHRDCALVPVNIEAAVEHYRDIQFFRRGQHRDTLEVSEWFGWRKRRFESDIYDDVVLMVTTKNEEKIVTAKNKKKPKSKIRPGAMLLKYFHNIPVADLNALFPDVRVVMRLRDQLIIGVPALLGGVPILLKLASTLTVLFVLAGFYLGLTNAAQDDELGAALAAVSGLVALGGFIVTQWVKFQRQTLMYQKLLADNIYYRNINNNAGIFDYLIGAAEEQDCKEAFLAYRFLLAGGGLTPDALDRQIEDWLRRTLKIDIDFECSDAIAKLDRLGLLRRDGERLSVLPPDQALARLDGVWDAAFRYSGAERS